MNIPYTKHEVTPDDISAVTQVLQSDFLTNGGVLVSFEDEFRQRFNSDYSVGVSSGTAGLHLAVNALGVRPEQSVIVPSLTFAATANAVLYNGAKVEFVDIDPRTLLIDTQQVEDLMAENPKKYAGVIAVDFAGYPADSKELSDVCKERGAWLIEDAAHALGAVSTRHGEEVVVGSSQYADASVFSFHPAKHITTGEGGMVTTRNDNVDKKLRLLRSHGMDKSNDQARQEGWYYRINDLGYNYRLSEINAALGMSQLRRFGGNVAARQAIAKTYGEAFEDSAVDLPHYDDTQVNAYHLFVVRVQRRQRVYDALRERGIFTQVHYVPLHMQPLYKEAAGDHNFPHTESYYQECLSIPMYPTLSDNEQEYVIDALKTVVDSEI